MKKLLCLALGAIFALFAVKEWLEGKSAVSWGIFAAIALLLLFFTTFIVGKKKNNLVTQEQFPEDELTKQELFEKAGIKLDQ